MSPGRTREGAQVDDGHAVREAVVRREDRLDPAVADEDGPIGCRPAGLDVQEVSGADGEAAAGVGEGSGQRHVTDRMRVAGRVRVATRSSA